jgi:hypothetical protein
MNDPIEEALRRMKPSELPPSLMARLTAARPQGAKKEEEAPAALAEVGFLRRWLLPLMGCAAAAVATVLWLNSTENPVRRNPSGVPNGATPVQFSSEDRFVGAREVGIMAPSNRAPIRLMEVEWLETNTMRPRQDGSAVRVETTRRGVIPVPLEIY